MSSTAVQSSSSNRQYPAQAQQQYHTTPHNTHNASSSPATTRKPVARRSSGNNGASPGMPSTPQQHQSPNSNTSNLNTPRAVPLPSSNRNSPAMASNNVPASAVPPRSSSSHQRSQTRNYSSASEAMQNISLEDPSSSSRTTQSNGNSDEYSQSRRRAQGSRDGAQQQSGGSSSRSIHSPQQSRSTGAMGTLPAGVALPREDSTVISRIITSDPSEDIARERARQDEARGLAPSNITPVTGLTVVGNEGVDDGGRGAGKTRQDHSKSGRVKETRFGEYILGQTLGEGEFGKVKMGWKKEGGVQVAIKLIRREALGTNPSRLPKIYREISILRGLSHPNIVRLHEMVETERHIGIILEYASGGELFDYILTHRYLKDPLARRLFAQLVSGVGYLHKKGIVHRDLKLENLMLDRNRNIIITDFGFANTFNPTDELGDEVEYNLNNRDYVKKMGLEQLQDDGTRRGDLMQTSCGSPCYAAPELVVSDSLYTGRKVDVWSCGVILYAMLAGYLPFDDDPANPEGDNINLLYKYIVSTPLTFPEYVTPHARDLLRRILVPDPRKRADLFEVARHTWLQDFHHVVAHITSSTTTVTDIANTTVPSRKHRTNLSRTAGTKASTEESYEPPMLARSASVREPTKPSVPVSTVGGLQKQHGNVDPNEQEKQARATRTESKRRTVQVEYVAPQQQTARGESSPAASQQTPIPQTTPRTRTRTDQPTEIDNREGGYRPPSSSRRPSASQQTPQTQQRSADHAHGRSGGNRAVSDYTQPANVPLSSMPAQTTARPATGGSIGPRLPPSRGNSYALPAAATVAPTNAEGRFSQPKTKDYVISAPINQQNSLGGDGSAGRPAGQRIPSNYAAEPPEARSHRRSNTVSGFGEKIFGKSGSFFGARQSVDHGKEKKYPPTSMPASMSNDEPRQSTESSRRMSFGFNRKNNHSSNGEGTESKRQSRRFSLIPASLKNAVTGGNRDSQSGPPPNDSRRASAQPPRSRGQTRPNTGGINYGRGNSRSPSQSTMNSNVPGHYDGVQETRYREDTSPQHVRNDSRLPPTSAPATQPQYSNHAHSTQQTSALQYPTHDDRYYNQANDSEASQPVVGGRYPPGFNRNDSPGTSRERPGVLQKHRKFADAYDDNGGKAASSSSSKKVSDWFRRIGRQRTRDS